MSRRSFVEPGDFAEVGDEVVFESEDGHNLIRGFIADRALSPFTGKTRYRIVDVWSESSDPDAGRLVSHDRLFSISSLDRQGEAL